MVEQHSLWTLSCCPQRKSSCRLLTVSLQRTAMLSLSSSQMCHEWIEQTISLCCRFVQPHDSLKLLATAKSRQGSKSEKNCETRRQNSKIIDRTQRGQPGNKERKVKKTPGISLPQCLSSSNGNCKAPNNRKEFCRHMNHIHANRLHPSHQEKQQKR